MSKAIITNSALTNIADAIRTKGGTSASLTPAQMPAAIAAIPTGTSLADLWAGIKNGTVTEVDLDTALSASGIGVSTDAPFTVHGIGWFGGTAVCKVVMTRFRYEGGCFSSATHLEELSVYVLTNAQTPFSGCTSLQSITTVKDTSTTVLSYASFLRSLSGSQSTVKIHCNDNKYVAYDSESSAWAAYDEPTAA